MLGENLKLLRKNKNLSQEELANELGLTRSSYSGYENSVAEPGLQTLLKISDFYQVSLDILAKEDLRKVDVNQLTNRIDKDLDGNHIRILATTVNADNEENIELVSQKASAGYRNGYADPDFISVLPTFQLPFLKKDRKYRTFPISGDSMPPVTDGSFVVAEYVESWKNIQSGYPYIVVTKEEGIVFKILYNRINDNQSFQLCSTNPFYKPYEIHVNDIIEIWKFVNYISDAMPTQTYEESELTKVLLDLQADVKHIKNVYIPNK